MTPLEDPSHEPEHPPENGQIPEVVAKWGKASQLRWFKRFGGDLHPRQTWGQYWCESEHHPGLCCHSCQGELRDGYHGGGVMSDGWCCCRDRRGPGSWGA